MANTTVNYVKKSDGTTIIDIRDTTATAEDVASGKYFYTASGVRTAGTSSGGGGVSVEALSVTANGTYTAPTGKAYSPVTVNVQGGGGSSASASNLNFIDYDGTILHSYTTADALALTALPSNPSHTGLTAQGWNWTLAKIQSYLTKYPDATVNVGQMYVTDDGKTRLYIYIDPTTPANRMTFYVRFTSTVANNVTIDWGDGTTEVKGSTTATNYPHTYTTTGDYVIALTVNSGTISFVGSSGSNGNAIYGSVSNTYSYNRGRIRKAEIGSGVTSIGNYAFYQCYSLTSITVPNSVTSIGSNAFQNCYALISITVQDGVTSIGASTFNNCYALTSITIPDGVTSIGAYAFQNCYVLISITVPDSVTSIGMNAVYNCYALTSITIPDGVTSIVSSTFYRCYSLTSLTVPDSATSIGSSAFYQCYGISEYHLLPSTPPTLANAGAFTGIVSDCIIYVPYSADGSILAAYKAATNWSSYASRMQEEPQ